MSKKPIGVVSNIDDSGNAEISLDNGNVIWVDDMCSKSTLRVRDAIHGKTFSISGASLSDATSTILDEVTYDE